MKLKVVKSTSRAEQEVIQVESINRSSNHLQVNKSLVLYFINKIIHIFGHTYLTLEVH